MKSDQKPPTNQQPRQPMMFRLLNEQAIDKYIEVVLLLAIGLVPLIFSPLTNELFEFPKMVFVYFLAIIGILLVGLKSFQEKKIALFGTPLNKPLFLFIFAFIISTILSIDLYTSIAGYYSRFNGGLTSVIAFLILFYLVLIYLTPTENRKIIQKQQSVQQIAHNGQLANRIMSFLRGQESNPRPPQQRSDSSELLVTRHPSPVTTHKAFRLLWAWLISSAIVSVWGIMEHFGYDPSCYILHGTLGADCWVQDVQARVFATLGQPNWLAAYLVATIPLGIAMLIINKSVWGRRAVWLTLVLNYAAFWYTYSRSGWIGLAVALILLIPLLTHIRRQRLWLWFATLGISCVLISMSGASMATQRTSTSLESGELDSSTGQIRLLVWQGTIDTIQQYPLFGSGPETFAYSFLPHRPAELNQTTEWNFLYNKAHNEVLHIAATLGLIGLATWLFLYFKLGHHVWPVYLHSRHIQKTQPYPLVQIALFSGIAGVFVSQLLGFSVVITSLLFWVAAALIIAPAATLRHYSLANTYTRRLFIVSIILLTAFAGWITTRYFVAEIAAARGSSSSNIIAAHNYRQAIAFNPYEPTYHQQLSYIYAYIAQFGTVQSQQDYLQRSLDQAKAAEKLNPYNILNLKGLTYTYRQLGQIDPKHQSDTIRLAKAAVRRDPADAVAQQLLAQAYFDADQPESALSTYNTIINLRPQAALSYQLRANYYKTYGSKSLAIADLKHALELEPNNKKVKEELDGILN